MTKSQSARGRKIGAVLFGAAFLFSALSLIVHSPQSPMVNPGAALTMAGAQSHAKALALLGYSTNWLLMLILPVGAAIGTYRNQTRWAWVLRAYALLLGLLSAVEMLSPGLIAQSAHVRQTPDEEVESLVRAILTFLLMAVVLVATRPRRERRNTESG